MGTALTYNEARRRWEGCDAEDRQRIWMDDATFQRHVWDYLASQQIYQPLLGDVDKAREHCRQWEYWCACSDPAIHRVVIGVGSETQQ